MLSYQNKDKFYYKRNIDDYLQYLLGWLSGS